MKYQDVFLGKCYDRGCFSFQSTIEKKRHKSAEKNKIGSVTDVFYRG